MHYFNDRMECLKDYYHCSINNKQNQKKKNNCNLEYVYNWIKLFIYIYNITISNKILFVSNKILFAGRYELILIFGAFRLFYIYYNQSHDLPSYVWSGI